MEEKAKKSYKKPQIKQVNLVPEEAVLLGCKTAADASGKVAGVNNCGNRDDYCDLAAS